MKGIQYGYDALHRRDSQPNTAESHQQTPTSETTTETLNGLKRPTLVQKVKKAVTETTGDTVLEEIGAKTTKKETGPRLVGKTCGRRQLRRLYLPET